MSAAKAAYQRRHGMQPRPPESSEPRPRLKSKEGPSSATEVAFKPPRAGGAEKTWAQRRKENILARSGARPRDADVAATAIAFVSKLKVRASVRAQRRPRRATASSEASSEAASARSRPQLPLASALAASTPVQKTWAQRRKENVLARSGARPQEADVATTAISLVSKLKVRARQQELQPPGGAAGFDIASPSALRAGDACVIVGGDSYPGCQATFVVVVDETAFFAAHNQGTELDEAHAFVKLSDGKRAVLPLSQLRRVRPDPASSPPRLLHATQSTTPEATTKQIQQKRALKRGRGERRSREAMASTKAVTPHEHVDPPLHC